MEKVLEMAVKLAEKFVNKVETKRAFSRETYKECKEFLGAYEQLKCGVDYKELLKEYFLYIHQFRNATERKDIAFAWSKAACIQKQLLNLIE